MEKFRNVLNLVFDLFLPTNFLVLHLLISYLFCAIFVPDILVLKTKFYKALTG